MRQRQQERHRGTTERRRTFGWLPMVEGTSGQCSSSPATAMDPRIWSRLPDELLDHVLSFLPIKRFLNLRSTCKRFRSLVFSPSFVSKLSSAAAAASSSSSFSSFLLLSHSHFHRLCFPLYDSNVGKWRRQPLSLSLRLPCSTPFTLLSASRGLLCFFVPNSSSFLLCNLLASSSRRIDFPTPPFAFELLTLVCSPAGYKIFVLSSAARSSCAFLYDSAVHSWRQFDGFDPILSDNYHREGVSCNGRLYFATSDPFSVVSFDLNTGDWEKSTAELPPELTFIRLVSSGEGKLYMIGGVGRNGISRSMKLWEMGAKGESWTEVETLPDGLCRKFMSVCYHNYERVYCLWHEGMICVCCYTWPEILYYKLSRGTWHWLPKCPSLPDKCSCGFRWFSFVPELCPSV